MKISLIAAVDLNGGIGLNNQLPWRLSDDLKRFKALTMGHHIIMGRKTYESIGKPLTGRINIIVTRNLAYQVKGCVIANSPREAIDYARMQGDDEVFIIGGSQIFSDTIDIADRLYLTTVHVNGEADTFFPEYDPSEWVKEFSEHFLANNKNEFRTTFEILNRDQAP